MIFLLNGLQSDIKVLKRIPESRKSSSCYSTLTASTLFWGYGIMKQIINHIRRCRLHKLYLLR